MNTTVAFTPHRRALGRLIVAISLAAIGYATLTPERASSDYQHLCIVCGSNAGVDAILNVMLFVPLGVGLALSVIGGRLALITTALLSILIETLQLAAVSGRNATLADVLTNTLGAALGFAATRHSDVWLHPTARKGQVLTIAGASFFLIAQAVSSFAFTPSLPESQYYGQLAHSFAAMETFRGEILNASIAHETVPDSRIPNGALIRESLLDGAPVTATITAAGTTRRTAPIVRVADTEMREIVMLAQRRDNLVFGVRSGAALLRLRSPYFALRDVFTQPDSTADREADTVSISGRLDHGAVELQAMRRNSTDDRRISITGSLGWVLILPFQWRLEGTTSEKMIASLWIFLLILPYACFNAATRSGVHSDVLRRKTLELAGDFAILFAGLTLVPLFFGVSASPLGDWLAGLAAIGVGYIAGAQTPARR